MTEYVCRIDESRADAMGNMPCERREIAARLRKTRVERYNSILNGIHLGEIVGVGAQIVSPHEDQVRAAADRLADLIDPGEPKVRCVAEVKVDGEQLEKLVHDAAVELTGIDRDALLALAEEIDSIASFAEEAGRASGSMGTGTLMESERRLREACGVEA